MRRTTNVVPFDAARRRPAFGVPTLRPGGAPQLLPARRLARGCGLVLLRLGARLVRSRVFACCVDPGGTVRVAFEDGTNVVLTWTAMVAVLPTRAATDSPKGAA